MSDRRSSVEGKVFTPFNGLPASLGGSPPSGIDRVAASTSACCSLERIAVLPPLPQGNKIENKNVREIYHRSCSGNFMASWTVEQDDELNLIVGVIHGDGKTELVFHSIINTEGGETNFNTGIIPESTFLDSLSRKQITALSNRTLHNFLRANGVCLPWRIVKGACKILFDIYKQKNYILAHDIAMVLVDVAMNQCLDDEEIVSAFRFVGPSLVALERYSDAGHVYLEEANILHRLNEEYFVTFSYGRSAQAFQQGEDFAMAEEAYVKTLHCFQECLWDVETKSASELANSFILMYEQWSIMEPDELQAFDLAIQITILSHLFALVGVNVQISLFVSPGNKTLLKRKFRTKNQAKNILLLAVQNASVKDFRATIAACFNVQYTNQLKTQLLEIRSTTEMSESTGVFEDMGRVSLNEVSKSGSMETFVFCCNPLCNVRISKKADNYKKCPCLRVNYCQKSCQVAHWKLHKQSCTYQAARKKKQPS